MHRAPFPSRFASSRPLGAEKPVAGFGGRLPIATGQEPLRTDSTRSAFPHVAHDRVVRPQEMASNSNAGFQLDASLADVLDEFDFFQVRALLAAL